MGIDKSSNISGPGDVDSLLSVEPSMEAGRALMAWVESVMGRMARGDLLIGILSIQEVQKVPIALSRAAECGMGQALLDLAWWLASPPIGQPDLERADQVLSTAIERKIPGARMRMVQLRWFFQQDELTEAQRSETYEICRITAREDEQNGEALYYLGLLTCAGFGTEPDPAAAVALQRQAANLGSADAMFELYVHYSQGLGVSQNDQAAFDANQQAAMAGHSRAMYNMGALYATGQVVERDMTKAAEWYEKAADAGNPRALATLAAMYAVGDGVETDKEYAEELFGQAEYLGLDVQELRASVGL